MNILNYIIENENQVVRADKFLSDTIEDMSRSSVASIIEDGGLLVNDKLQNKKYKLKIGDKVRIAT